MLNSPLGSIVTQDYRIARIFERYGIDFCCGGKKTLGEACKKQGIDPNLVMADIAKLQQTENRDADDTMTLDTLIDHILTTHHTYVAEQHPYITQLLTKVVRAHGDNHPEVHKLQTIRTDLVNELQEHMIKEEQILFPAIKDLVIAQQQGLPQPSCHCGSLIHPITQMENEHTNAGDAFVIIHELTNNYTIPADACPTYTTMLQSMQAFEIDLHRHIHLESNILFPKALALEASF